MSARLPYPVGLTADLAEILAFGPERLLPLARKLRRAGHTVEQGAYTELGYARHWLIGLYLEHGAAWREVAAARVGSTVEVQPDWRRGRRSA